MKTQVQLTWSLGLILVAMPLRNPGAQEAQRGSATEAPAVAPQAAAESNQPAVQTNTAPVQGSETNLADAAF